MDSIDAEAATGITLANLPPELLLEAFGRVPYDPRTVTALRLTSRDFDDLITTHEQSLVLAIRSQQFSSTTLRLFPSLGHSLHGLSDLHGRLQTLAEVHAHWLKITHNGPELHWLRDRWESAHRAGMLLLYRLRDAASHPAKADALASLPATSLACLIFKLYSSIKILRLYGPEPINLSYAAGDVMARSDVELAFEELLLIHGPDFFVVLLRAGRSEAEKRQEAVQVLEKEVAGMEQRQLPLPDGAPRPPTLISTLRRAFAARMHCHISEVTSQMWELLSGTVFDRVDDETMACIVNGEDLSGKGMRRMGY